MMGDARRDVAMLFFVGCNGRQLNFQGPKLSLSYSLLSLVADIPSCYRRVDFKVNDKEERQHRSSKW